MKQILSSFLIVVTMFACSSKVEQQQTSSTPVLTGIDGKAYYEPPLSEQAKAKLDSQLSVAKKNLEADASEENYIWFGRRQAYRYQYAPAVETFSDGLEKFPESFKLLRHRGHRYITLRNFDKGIADLAKAASLMPAQPLEIEPDGIPNKLNTPLSTTQFNVWYHLGLGHYLKGDFEKARQAYDSCLAVSNNDDLVCATVDWLYMTLQRMGQKEAANKLLEKISPEMNIIENDSYHKRLLMYKGMLPPDSVLNVNAASEDADLAIATQGYGVGNWYLCQGDTAKATEIFKRVVAGKHFSAFGFIAAEADLVRLK